MTATTTAILPRFASGDDVQEKPQNGLAGLKHWRHDIASGLLVSLVSLPFSLGIAIASGAPPICGVVSAIIAGLVLPFLGGSYVTISGPAAGLAPILLAAMLSLGKGDLAAGYPLLLAVICMAGILQIVLSYFKAARFCALFPASVVEGMLGAIGLLIIVKQFPVLLGTKFAGHDFLEILAETPQQLRQLNPQVFGLGLGTLALIFLLASIEWSWLKILPPQVIAVVAGTATAAALLTLDPALFINIPDKPLERGIVFPHFSQLWFDHSLWLAAATAVVTLTLIDGVESLATIAAIDKIDPFHRKSSPNRTLFAMGVSNICSSMLGGLTIIPGGVKSTTNVLGGGRTQWANFYNACFLLIFLILGRDLINLIPQAVLGAVLVYTGYRLCRPSVWRHIAHIGREQLVPFTVTLAVTVCTDLLVGIGAGIATKLVMNLWFSATAAVDTRPTHLAILAGIKELPAHFSNPVTKREQTAGEYHLYFGKPLVCFNALHLNRELEMVPANAKKVYLHITEAVLLIDHTSCDKLFHFVDERNRHGRTRVEIVGLDHLGRRSEYRTSMRLVHRSAWARGLSRLMASRRLEHMQEEHDPPTNGHEHLANDELAKYTLSAMGPNSAFAERNGHELEKCSR